MLSTLVIVRSMSKILGEGQRGGGGEGEVGVVASGNTSPLAPRSHTTFCLNPLMFII